AAERGKARPNDARDRRSAGRVRATRDRSRRRTVPRSHRGRKAEIGPGGDVGSGYSAAVQYKCRFTCFAGHEGSWEVTEPIYRCPKCGGLLEVTHDVDALRDRSAAAWMKVFEQRYKGTAWPYGSGVWGKREWVMPVVPDELIVSMDEGGTNLFWAERFGKSLGLPDLWVKL